MMTDEFLKDIDITKMKDRLLIRKVIKDLAIADSTVKAQAQPNIDVEHQIFDQVRILQPRKIGIGKSNFLFNFF